MGDDTGQIRNEIEQTRARMGDTVEALAYKANAPARAKDAVNERVETVKEAVSETVQTVKEALSDGVATMRSGASDIAEKTAGLLHKDTSAPSTAGRELPEDD